METIEYKGEHYPQFQASGHASRFAIPFALEVCKGNGLDVGYGKSEWKFPGAHGVDSAVFNSYGADAMCLPLQLADDGRTPMGWDYIFSSHCLEHLPNWVEALDHWYDRLKVGGTLFLYLPDYSQVYWRPYNNRKHIHCLTPTIIADYLDDKGYMKVFVSGIDLNNSFICIAEK